ncbi:uncharacterized protein [Eurosta solidaginis]|uniref:uncharacterized protein n=1 Tax=Eurosta solidaginis TaxID=178769 RepID=UPI0035305C01
MEDQFFELMCEKSSSESANTSGRTEEFLDSSANTVDISENEEERDKMTNFLQVIESYTDQEFRRNFRLNSSTARMLIDRYNTSSFYTNKEHGGLPKVGASKEIYILLSYMANTNTFREIANLFNMSKSSAWRILRRVVEWLLSIGHEYIQWPSASKVQDNMRKFKAMKNIPNFVGCIDCSHINIKAPVSNKHAYFKRKQFYSPQLQVVVDADKMFIDVFAGEPGSLHDSRILRRSSIYEKATDDVESKFPFNSFLLGDTAYGNSQGLISAFRENGFLTPA